MLTNGRADFILIVLTPQSQVAVFHALTCLCLQPGAGTNNTSEHETLQISGDSLFINSPFSCSLSSSCGVSDSFWSDAQQFFIIIQNANAVGNPTRSESHARSFFDVAAR